MKKIYTKYSCAILSAMQNLHVFIKKSKFIFETLINSQNLENTSNLKAKMCYVLQPNVGVILEQPICTRHRGSARY